jgi:hypothetical protein
MKGTAMKKSPEQEAAIKALRKIFKPGDTVRVILRHVSRSGMSRSISVIQVKRGGETREWDMLVATALGEKIDRTHGGIKVGGCGMDMGSALVYDLSQTLYGGKRGYPCQGDRCPSNVHSNDPHSPRGKGQRIRHHDGYALTHRWL